MKKIFEPISEKIIYAKNIEPVRIGVFKAMFNESFRILYSDYITNEDEAYRVELKDTVLHGIIRETLKYRDYLKNAIRVFHHGIDYAIFINSDTEDKQITIPLFIIAKSDLEKVREVNLVEITKNISSHLEKSKTKKIRRIAEVIRNISTYTRVVITKAYPLEPECEPVLETGLKVYPNIICGIVGLMSEIPRICNEEARKLAGLSFSDWLAGVLLILPLAEYSITRGRPPKDDFGSMLRDVYSEITKKVDRIAMNELKIVEEIRQKIIEAVHRSSTATEKERNYAEN